MLYENLPTTKFRTLVIDPPWNIGVTSMRYKHHKRPRHLPYPTLPIDEIKTFPVQQLAEVGAHVYTWTTNKMLPDTFDVLKAWGVRYHLTMPLVKKSGIVGANGYVFAAEYCLLGFFGKPMLRFESIGKLNWLVTSPVRGKHSVKPDSFYLLVETMSPGPYLDCFARRQRANWTVWGNEVDSDIILKAS